MAESQPSIEKKLDTRLPARGGGVTRPVIGSDRSQTPSDTGNAHAILSLLHDEQTIYPDSDRVDSALSIVKVSSHDVRRHRRENPLKQLLNRMIHRKRSADTEIPEKNLRGPRSANLLNHAGKTTPGHSDYVPPVDPWADIPVSTDLAPNLPVEQPNKNIPWTKKALVKLTALLALLGGGGSYTGATVTHDILNPDPDNNSASMLIVDGGQETMGKAGTRQPTLVQSIPHTQPEESQENTSRQQEQTTSPTEKSAQPSIPDPVPPQSETPVPDELPSSPEPQPSTSDPAPSPEPPSPTPEPEPSPSPEPSVTPQPEHTGTT